MLTLVLQELLGGPARSGSPGLLGNLLGSSEGPRTTGPLHGLLHKGPSPPLFPQRAPSPDYFNSHLQPSAGKLVAKLHIVCKKCFIFHWYLMFLVNASSAHALESLCEATGSGFHHFLANIRTLHGALLHQTQHFCCGLTLLLYDNGMPAPLNLQMFPNRFPSEISDNANLGLQ